MLAFTPFWSGGAPARSEALRRLQKGRFVLRFLISTPLLGCYTLRPSQILAAPPESEVRILLSPAGMTALTNSLGPRVIEVSGRVVGWRPDSSLELTVQTVVNSSRQHDLWQGEGTVLFPADAIATIERRTFDRRRTVILSSVAIATTAVVAAEALKQGILGGGRGGGGPPPP